ncbi:energy-coupling factor transporter transmembrane protein EcfT [Psychrobacillus glaciei]|uniref:Energy-coupling factor transporter transmembrane protein EcfT n=1 Tax=Psychrobacillus glaciei TaxID=2283160 RepID=A0A5J6SHW4_9BACI|nr:energy-coupling factor transporter transmembrane component T [Psychrobacillus glaciei]QFF97496.1 energy-coupling factor transporter transmembrane protein EcfT [Psychrobacillus glaciei]
MSSTVLIGQYMETNSMFHRLDPRTKILCIFIIMLSFLTLETAISYVVSSLFVFGVLFLSNVPLHVFVRGLKPLLFILMFTFLYNVLLTKGTTIWSWSFIEVTWEGLENGMRYVGRIILLVLLASVLTLTTMPLDLARGLEKLLAPLSKLNAPVEQFSLMIVIAIRFIPTILQELDRILLAQKARGYDMSSLSLPKRIYAYIPILIPLLFTTIQRAEQLTYAIDARAYGKGKGRTQYKQLQFQQIDYIAGAIAILFVLTLLLIKLGGL